MSAYLTEITSLNLRLNLTVLHTAIKIKIFILDYKF